MNRISRTKAVNMIVNSKGKFFTVKFIKQNGETRVINGNLKGLNSLGYLRVNSIKDKQVRNVNTQTITGLTINGINYRVR